MANKQEPAKSLWFHHGARHCCKRAIGSEKSFSIRLVFSVESCKMGLSRSVSLLNPNPLGIFTRKYPESTKIHQFCHTQNAGVLNPSESASVDIGHILNPPKSTTNFLVDFGRFRIPCSHENLYSMLLHRIHQNLTYTVHVHVTIIHQPT